MDIYMYKNSAEKIVLNKDNYLSSEIHLSGYLRDECDIINPVIEISKAAYSKIWYGTETVDVQSTGQDVISENPYAIPVHNYIYIPKFNRYYFVDNITSVRKGLWRISMSVDVLMSFRDKINNLTGIVKRSTIATRRNIKDEAAIVPSYYSFEKYESVIDSPIIQNKSYNWAIVSVTINNNTISPTRFINDEYFYNYPDRIVVRRNSSGQSNAHPSNFKFLMENSRIGKQAVLNQFEEFIWYVAQSDQQNAVISLMVYPFNFVDSPFFEDITTGVDNEYLQYKGSFINPRGLDSIYQPVAGGYMINYRNFGIGSDTERTYSGCPICNTFNNKILIGRIDCTNLPENWEYSSVNSKYLLYIPFIGYRDIDYSKIVGKYVEVYFVMNWDDGSANVMVISTPSISNANRFNIISNNKNVVCVIDGLLHQVQCNLPEGEGLRNELLILEENVQVGISVPYSATNAAENSRRREAYTLQMTGSMVVSAMTALMAAALTPATGGASLAGGLAIMGGIMGIPAAGINYAAQERQLIDVTRTMGNLGNVANSCSPNEVHLLRCFYDVTYPDGYEEIIGKPDLTTRTISNIPNGYVQFAHIHIDGIDTATSNELDQIERELMNGILIN